MSRIICILSILVFAARVNGQADCFATVSLDRSSVYVQQPFKVTITVWTATFFTAPPEWTNIQIPDAFILQFDRTIPMMSKRDGKQYAGIQVYFIVFPYKEGSHSCPEIPITVHTPAPGNSKALSVTLHTAAKPFLVNAVPATTRKDWFVAKNVSVMQRWGQALEGRKVGEVLERTISVYAEGTLPQFIPPLGKDSLSFAATYLQEPRRTDERTEFDAAGRLIQKIVYLLNKEGDFMLPDVVITWWNPVSSKWYSRVAPGARIRVGANSNLGILRTVRDSLEAQAGENQNSIEKNLKKRGHLSWYYWVLIAGGGGLLLNWVIQWIMRVKRRYAKRHAGWLASEPYAFRQLLRSPAATQVMIRRLYCWFDRVRPPGAGFCIASLLKDPQHAKLLEELTDDLNAFYGGGTKEIQRDVAMKKEVREWRMKIKKGSIRREYPWVSPTQEYL